MSHDHFRFLPHHKSPGDPGKDPMVFAFKGRDLLVTEDGGLPDVSQIDEAGYEAVRRQYLGSLDGRHCFSAELESDASPKGGLRFSNLHGLYASLDEATHAVAGRAVQIVEWDRTHQFCGACAEPTVVSETDRSRACPSCRIPMYPRLAPAMIVAVERGDEILLGRSPHFPAGIMSVLAGFVEPGESAEDAVKREVYEETKILVKNVQYYSSQAWPFPNSLMLGFRAEYASGEIEVDGVEVVAAEWFKAKEMPNFFPGRVSISQWLIHDFLARNGVEPPA
ncbi:MAG: NAD(+) diphosphatase [Myxococcota bacterium]